MLIDPTPGVCESDDLQGGTRICLEFTCAQRSAQPSITVLTLVVLATAVTVAVGFTTRAGAVAPKNTVAPSVQGTARAGQMLTANPSSYESGDAPIAFSYAWQRCDAKGAVCVAANNGTNQTYTLGTAGVGTTLRVVVTAKNAAGTATATSAVSGMVAAAPVGAPAMASPPAIGGTPVTGSTLSAAPGNWTGVQPMAIAYAWQRCDANGGACPGDPERDEANLHARRQRRRRDLPRRHHGEQPERVGLVHLGANCQDRCRPDGHPAAPKR